MSKARRWASTEGVQRRILDAARDVFHRQGFNDATIADITAAAGCSIGSIYHHFGGKNELFQALSDRAVVLVEAEIDENDWERSLLWASWRHRFDLSVLMNPFNRPTDYPPAGRSLVLERLGGGGLHERAQMALMREATLVLIETDTEAEAARVIESTVQWVDLVRAIQPRIEF